VTARAAGAARVSTWRERLRARAPLMVVGIAALITYALVVPRMGADGTARNATAELDEGQPLPGLRKSRTTARNLYGFVVSPYGSSKVSFAIPPSFPVKGDRTILRVTAGGGPDVSTEVYLIDQAGSRHLLGRPEQWHAQPVDVTSLVRQRGARLEFSATNSGNATQLFADQVLAASYPAAAIPRATRWEVGALIALVVLFVLVATHRARRDAALIFATGLLAFLVWPSIVASALGRQPGTELWTPAIDAKWLDLDRGLLSGTFGGVSHLAVQLFHPLTFVTGTGLTGAGVASMVVGLAALVAIYYMGLRVAGPVGAVAATVCALLTDPFRASLTDGSSTTTLVLAACLFLIAAHRVLQRGDRGSMMTLGAAGALAILAEPLWWPAVVAAVVLLALRHAPHAGRRRVALAAGLGVLVLLSLPSRVSVADQTGDLNGDVVRRLTVTRNVEFVARGHGAPPDQAALDADPAGGPQVGLVGYLLGDHGVFGVIDGTVSGASDSVFGTRSRPQSKLLGVVAFLLEIAGVLVLLLVARLRLLVLIAALLPIVPWFLASRGVIEPFPAGAAFFPALLLGGATVAYIAARAARENFAGASLTDAVAAGAAVLRRRERSPRPG
jgi:hypothetical protein